jgi:hypothetical protein
MGEVFASFRRKGTTKNHSGNSMPLALIGHAAGTRAQGSIVMRARNHDHARGLGYQVGAGEGNRTPTISLGSFVIRPLNRPDQLVRMSAVHRH